MAGSRTDSDEMITGINVTPLVDVVLVLLVIFMITAPMMYQAQIKVNLPKATSGEKMEAVTLKFTLEKDGHVTVDNQQISPSQIGSFVKTALKKDPEARAVISADSSATHGAVVSLIDAVKNSGISHFAISVQNRAGKKI